MTENVSVQPRGEVMSRWWHSRTTTKALLAAGIASVVVYGLGDLVSGLLYDGYSYRDQAISELAAFGSPVRPLMAAVVVVHGLLLIAFGLGIWRSADHRSLRWVGPLLIVIGVVGLPNHTVFAMSSRWMEAGFNDTMHIILSNVFSLLVFVAVALSAVAYRGWFRFYAIVTQLVLIGFGAAAWNAMQGVEQNSTLWVGGFERVNAYAYFAWLVVLAVTVMRRSVGHGAAETGGTAVEANQPAMMSAMLRS
jgi:hypothetical membrane protein